MSGGSGSGTRVATLLLLTFAAGFAAGIVVERGIFAPRRSDAVAEGRGDRQATIERFADELGLTQEQRERIRPIVEETRQRLGKLFENVRPAYHAVVDSARARIEAVLTPEQVTRYRELLEQQRGAESNAERRSGDGGSSPPDDGK